MKMNHPESKLAVDVRKDQIEMYESQGWSEAKRDKPEKPEGK